jgi:hypothetical protein
MAELEKIAESLNIKLTNLQKKPSDHALDKKSVGQKRRAWLIDEEKSNEKGSINPVHKTDLSIGFINSIYRPLLEKGSIKGVYKPLLISLQNLRGNPFKIIQYLFELSRNQDEKITEKTTHSQIMKKLEISKDSAKTAIRFLLKNKLIERVNFQIGKMGWSKYRIKKDLYDELEKAYLKGSINPINQKGSNSSSSYINTTTIKDRPLLTWDDIDISPLENIGLTKKHLLQLKKNQPEIVQESINHFSYGLKYNTKTKKYDDPIAVLMGVLRKGEAWVEPSYKSVKEIAQQEFIERKLSEQERLKKLEEESYKLALDEWIRSLTTEEIEQISSNKIRGEIMPQQVRLSIYFKKNIWINKKMDYVFSN